MKKYLIGLFIFSLLSLNFALAEDLKFSAANYDEAAKQESKIEFKMESTKLGLVTTGFTSYVRDFVIHYDKSSNAFDNVVVTIMANSLDTDNSSRNEKMYDLCLSVSKYKEITVRLTGKVELSDTPRPFPALLNIRGKDNKIDILLRLVKEGEKEFVQGEAKVSLKGLEIPDPSIFIAKVKDQVNLNFKIFLH